MQKLNRILITLSVVTLLTGCASLFTGVVTVTDVVKSAMKQWAHLSNTGVTTAALDAKVVAAHDKYRQTCEVAQKALIAYKATGDQAEYLKAFEVVKAAASGLVDLIVPLLTQSQGTTIKANLAKAQVL